MKPWVEIFWNWLDYLQLSRNSKQRTACKFRTRLHNVLTELLEIKLQHATLRHPQTVGVGERALGAWKRVLKINTDEQWTTGYKYVDLACFLHNTSFCTSIGCAPSLLFHGRHPVKPIDLRFHRNQLTRKELSSYYLLEIQNSLLKKYAEAKFSLLEAYQRYWTYSNIHRTYRDHTWKANSKPLKLHSLLFVAEPTSHHPKWFRGKINSLASIV